MSISLSLSRDALAVFPMASIALFGIVLLVIDLFLPRSGKSERGSGVGVIACTLAWILSRPLYGLKGTAMQGLVYVDSFVFGMNSILLLGTALALLLGDRQLAAQRVRPSADVNVLILFATCGGMAMVAAADLIVLFLGFELLSVCVYILTGLARTERASSEGALKYFILGAFSSAFLLYGMALVYGATGSMSLEVIRSQAQSSSPMLLTGLGLILFGFGFKTSLVPFHFWSPDVYQGAPVSITGFMAVVVKAAAFGAFLRLMIVPFGALVGEWSGLVWVLSALTMTVGNLVALRQQSIKRMLAYSSISHAGYILMGFLALGKYGGKLGGEAVVYYLLVYSLMTIASFGIVLLASGDTDAQYGKDSLESLRGYGWRHPLLGICMIITLLSLAGMPPLAGFFGKFYLFAAVIKAGYPGLAIIAALNSVVSLYYYLGVLVVMYFGDQQGSAHGAEHGVVASDAHSAPTSAARVVHSDQLGPQIAIGLATFGILTLGIFADPLIRVARMVILSLT